MDNFTMIKADSRSIWTRKPIFGVGINDAWYQTQPKIGGKRMVCPFYRTWAHMIERAHSVKYLAKKPTYKDCSVCEEWLLFSAFRYWMIGQEWQGKELDKDIISPDNKIYSPEGCCFVTRAINCLLTNSGASRGKYPQGVCFNKKNEKYAASCSYKNRTTHIGYFNTPEEASIAYKNRKREIIIELAARQTDQRIKSGLLRHANRLQSCQN